MSCLKQGFVVEVVSEILGELGLHCFSLLGFSGALNNSFNIKIKIVIQIKGGMHI